MQVPISYAIPIDENNQSLIAVVKNDGWQRRAKTTDIKYYFVRDQVEDKNIELNYTETKPQLAGFLTKPISKKNLNSLIDMAKIRDF